MTIAREGFPYLAALLGLGTLMWFLRQPWPSAVLLVLGAFTAFFFRDPERDVPQAAGLVVSPADGRVVRVVEAPADHPLGPHATQISIFLSIFDVHINRAPIGGAIEKLEYHAGEFLPAFDDKASLRNEQNSVMLRDGEARVEFKQIAGLIARRIVFRKRAGERVERGERVGLIKFGSRVDLLVPQGCEIRTRVGDRVRGGVSVLAAWR
jgi:phosphatidylserine decarboxylase